MCLAASCKDASGNSIVREYEMQRKAFTSSQVPDNSANISLKLVMTCALVTHFDLERSNWMSFVESFCIISAR